MESLPINIQTTLNGGGTRPRLDWEMLQSISIGYTRKFVPIEAVRFISTSDSYLKVVQHYIRAQDSKFLFLRANNDIPQKTCFAVDSEVMMYLRGIHYRKLKNQIKNQKCYDCVVAHLNQGPEPSIVQATVCSVMAAWNGYVEDWQAIRQVKPKLLTIVVKLRGRMHTYLR